MTDNYVVKCKQRLFGAFYPIFIQLNRAEFRVVEMNESHLNGEFSKQFTRWGKPGELVICSSIYPKDLLLPSSDWGYRITGRIAINDLRYATINIYASKFEKDFESIREPGNSVLVHYIQLDK